MACLVSITVGCLVESNREVAADSAEFRNIEVKMVSRKGSCNQPLVRGRSGKKVSGDARLH